MGDLLKRGVDWLAAQVQAHASRLVSYEGDTGTVTVSATLGQTLFRLDASVGAAVEFSDRDYLIVAADLGVQYPPKRGHQITDSDGVYEVLAPPDEAPYRNSDPYGVLLRIHCKKVSD